MFFVKFPLWYVGSDVGGHSPCPVRLLLLLLLRRRCIHMYVRLGVVWVGSAFRVSVSVSVCMSVNVCTRVDTWVPTAEARDGGAMSCVVSCRLGEGRLGASAGRLPRMHRQAGRQAGGNRRRANGRAGTTVCFMHNCWCECRKSGWWDLRAVRAFCL